MNYIALVQAFFFYGYCIYLVKNFGILQSISDSWYKVKNKWMFNLFASGTGLPFWFYDLDSMDGMMFVFSGLLMFGLSIASMFKDGDDIKFIHYGCTIGAILFALAGIYIQKETLVPVQLVIIGGVFLLFKNSIWWIEIWIFTVIISFLL